jgi:uncharacterized membrane protein
MAAGRPGPPRAALANGPCADLWQPWGMRIEVSREIGAPAERVWALITDLPDSPSVVSAITSVEILGGGEAFEVGTRWRETRTMFGRVATEEMEVATMDPGRSYTVTAGSHGTRYESAFEVIPAGDHACILRMTFAGEPTSVASRVMAATIGRMFAGATRRAVEQDLADIAGAAEAGSGGTSAESGGRPVGP